MKRAVAIMVLISILLCFSACSFIEQTFVNPLRSFQITGGINTSFDGVYLTLEEINTDEKYPVFTVKWHNDSNSTITFGMGYFIERLDGEEWKSVQSSDFAIVEIACIMEPGQSGDQIYSGEYFSFKETGTYRIRTEFYIQDGEFSVQSSWVTFEVLKTKF